MLYLQKIDTGEQAGRFLIKLPRGSLIFQRLKKGPKVLNRGREIHASSSGSKIASEVEKGLLRLQPDDQKVCRRAADLSRLPRCLGPRRGPCSESGRQPEAGAGRRRSSARNGYQ